MKSTSMGAYRMVGDVPLITRCGEPRRPNPCSEMRTCESCKMESFFRAARLPKKRKHLLSM